MFVRKCCAKARTNNHQPCRQPAMANGRCRLHGGKSCGAKTIEGSAIQKKASWKHGTRSQAVLEERRAMREYTREIENAMEDL